MPPSRSFLKNTFAFLNTAFTSSYFPLFCNPFSGNTFAYRKTAFTSVYLPPALLYTSRSFATLFQEIPLLTVKRLSLPYTFRLHLFILSALLQPLFQEIPLLTVKRPSLPYTFRLHFFILPALLQPLFQEIPLLTVKRLSLPYTFRLHFGVFPSLCSSREKGFDAFYGAVEFAFVLREYT